MTEKVELVEVSTDDWVALYENGVKTWEGHSLNVGDVLGGLVGHEIVSYKSYYVDSDVIEDVYGCEFPLELSRFKEEHLK